MINSVLNSSLQGVLKGMESMDRTAHDIAKIGSEDYLDISESTSKLVDLKTHEQGIQANLSVIRVSDSMLGTLLDERV